MYVLVFDFFFIGVGFLSFYMVGLMWVVFDFVYWFFVIGVLL